MIDQHNFAVDERAGVGIHPGQSAVASRSVVVLAGKLGLTLGSPVELTIRRIRRGKGYSFLRPNGSAVRQASQVRRFNALAVPPAYRDVLYAADPSLHLQAVGRDAAGRLQYRYHADWEKVRETRKAHRLAKLVGALPRIRRNVAKHLAGHEPTREFALSAVIELIAKTAIRPGNESYAKLHGTRGATTLLKSNIKLDGNAITLTFRGKGGKDIEKTCKAPKLLHALDVLRKLPGRRMFQYRDAQGKLFRVSTAQVNEFLRDIAGIKISLKDFRTLVASAAVLDTLSRLEPGQSERARRRQVLDAVRAAADELANTPAICRKSYVHDTIVAAFEDGTLQRIAAAVKTRSSLARREVLLAKVVATAA